MRLLFWNIQLPKHVPPQVVEVAVDIMCLRRVKYPYYKWHHVWLWNVYAEAELE